MALSKAIDMVLNDITLYNVPEIWLDRKHNFLDSQLVE